MINQKVMTIDACCNQYSTGC